MMDMRYMWSAMDSGCGMEKRRHPSRGVVLRRWRRWRKGIGVLGGVGEGWRGGGRVERTESRVQGWARGAAVAVAERGSLVGG